MKLLNKVKISIVTFVILLLTGCMMPQYQLESLKELKKDEVIYVGKLQLSPHIRKDEIIYENTLFLPDNVHKQLRLIASDKFFDLKGKAAHDYTDSVLVYDGEYFYFTWKRNKPLHVLGATFTTRWTQTNRDSMTFTIKKGVKVKHGKKGKAFYLGNITFKRDEFFNIKKIDINQKGMKRAQKAFKKKYKTRLRLKKAKLTSSR